MHIDFLLDVFRNNREKEAIIWKEKSFNYQWLLGQVHFWQEKIRKKNIAPGTVVILEADFSPNALALLLV
mgnify:FL=1